MKLFSFEKLNVWQKSRELSKTIYNITKSFPDDERLTQSTIKLINF